MKLILAIIISLPFSLYCQEFPIIGKYNYKLDFKHTPIFRDFHLELKGDSSFFMTKYVYEVDYSYKDTLEGKWTINKNIVSFYNIDQEKFINKYRNDSLSKQEILIKECVYSYENYKKEHIYLVSLDSDFNIIEINTPLSYFYNQIEKKLTTKFKYSENSFQLIYYRALSLQRKKYISKTYFEGGINLVNFIDYNIFEITNCTTTDNPNDFISPLIRFEFNKAHTLTSLKPFIEIDGKKRKRKLIKAHNKGYTQ